MRRLRALLVRFRGLFNQRREDRELDEEIESHLQMHFEDNLRLGMTPTEARRQALIGLGGIESTKEAYRDQRGLPVFESLWQDIRYGLRQLRRNFGFTVVVVLTVALGVGANTALFSVVNGVLLRPLPFQNSEQLVTMWESSPARGIEQQAVSIPNFADWMSQSRSFEEMGFWTGPADLNFMTQDGVQKIRGSHASSGLFRALRVTPQLGRIFAAEEDLPRGPKVAVISHKLWRERFGGDPKIVGGLITLDSSGPSTYTIIGVMPSGFQFPDDTELWLAAGWNGLPQDRRYAHWLYTIGRLKPGVTLSQAEAEMNTIQARLASQYSELGPDSKVSIVSLLRQTVGKTTRTALLVLWGIVAGVLLIACTNVANLMLARTTARQKEITLRVALGAGRGRIMRQLLTESMLLALLGGLLGILLGACGVKLFVATNPANIPRLAEASVDGIALCFTFGVTLLAGVLFGIVPAWQCSLADLNEVLKEGSRSSGSQSAGRMRSALIVVEVALATVLLIGAGLMLQSFAKLLSTDRGFRAEHVITAELDFSVSGAGFTAWFRPTATRPQVRLKELLERLRQLPGVQSAGEAWRFLRQNNNPPVNWQVGIFGRPLMPEGQRPIADVNAVSPGFFSALGIPLLRGRDFTEADTLTAPGVALVNESFARRYFPNGDTLGQHVTLGSNPGPLDTTDGNGISSWYEIVGIVGDVKSLSAQPEPVPEIYRSYWQWPADNPKIFVRATGDATALTEVIRREIHAVFPNSPAPKIRLLTDYIGKSIAQPRFQAGLLTLFGTLALVLAAFGIYGVLAYSVTQRRREIGVRMALGAPRRNVISLIIGQGLKLTLLGAGIGMIAALAFTRVMQSLIYSIKPTDPVTFIGITLLLLAVALLACWIPARHAAGIHPMEALRHE